MGLVLAAAATGCAAAPMKRPSAPLTSGDPKWPEDVEREAERVDRRCSAREAQLLYDYEEAKQEQQKFKTIMGSVTGGVGTVGGVIGGVGAYAIHSPSTMKTVTGVTGIVGGVLGAAGAVITVVISPGAAKLQNATKSLAAIDKQKSAARAALTKKDPSTWSADEKEAWAKSAKELGETCK